MCITRPGVFKFRFSAQAELARQPLCAKGHTSAAQQQAIGYTWAGRQREGKHTGLGSKDQRHTTAHVRTRGGSRQTCKHEVRCTKCELNGPPCKRDAQKDWQRTSAPPSYPQKCHPQSLSQLLRLPPAQHVRAAACCSINSPPEPASPQRGEVAGNACIAPPCALRLPQQNCRAGKDQLWLQAGGNTKSEA